MKAGLRKLFLATNGITSLVGDRTFVTRLPPRVKKDADHILITQISSDENNSLDGTSELRFLDIDVDCKATSLARTDAMSLAVRTFLKDYTGPAGDQEIKAVLFSDESDSFEPFIDGSDEGFYVTTLDFNIQYSPV